MFNADPSVAQGRVVGNFPLLPLRTKTRGPAYTLPFPDPPLAANETPDPDSESYDILDEDGKTTGRSYPVAAMVANLAKETPDRPALMVHFDVVTFFHEMGHVFHHLLSQTKFFRFHGTRCVYIRVFV